MALPTPITLTAEWRFVPTLRLFMDNRALPVCRGFLLYKQDGFEFTAAFQIEHFVVVCERKSGGDWFLCIFVGNQHYTIAPISGDMDTFVFGFALERLKLLGITDSQKLVFRPITQGIILRQLTAVLSAGFKG